MQLKNPPVLRKRVLRLLPQPLLVLKALITKMENQRMLHRLHPLHLLCLLIDEGERPRAGSALFVDNVRGLVFKWRNLLTPLFETAYTAMLRITTSSPPMPKGTEAEVDKEKRDSMASGSSHDEPVAPAANTDPLGASSAQAGDSGPGGFLRQISLMSLRGGNTTAADATLPPDLERQA